MAHDLFISYSSDDKPIADATCAKLEARRIRCWIAPRDIEVGQKFGEAITRAISTSRAVVLVFSGSVNRSKWVCRELERAVHHGLPIFPLRVEDVPLSDEISLYLAGQHWLDALTPPLEQHLERLADSVAAVLQLPPPPGPEKATSPADVIAASTKRKRPSRPWMIRVAAPILVAVIGVLALLVIWRATHPVKDEESGLEPPATSRDAIPEPETVFDIIPADGLSPTAASSGQEEGTEKQAPSPPRSILELPDDPGGHAVIWTDPKTPVSLSEEEQSRFNTWLMDKSRAAAPGQVLEVTNDITSYYRKQGTKQGFEPRDFEGTSFRGNPKQTLTDGKLAFSVTSLEKREYSQTVVLPGAVLLGEEHRLGTSSTNNAKWLVHETRLFGRSKLPLDYAVTYTLENNGTEVVDVDHFVFLFWEPCSQLGSRWLRESLKKDGDTYSKTGEPFLYRPGDKTECTMRTRGDCAEVFSVNLRVFYADSTESLFTVYLPPDEFVDQTTAK